MATLTPRGRSVQNKCRERLTEVEHRWQARFGGETIAAPREALERLVGEPGRAQLFAGLEPPPGGWRAGVRAKDTLPPSAMTAGQLTVCDDGRSAISTPQKPIRTALHRRQPTRSRNTIGDSAVTKIGHAR